MSNDELVEEVVVLRFFLAIIMPVVVLLALDMWSGWTTLVVFAISAVVPTFRLIQQIRKEAR